MADTNSIKITNGEETFIISLRDNENAYARFREIVSDTLLEMKLQKALDECWLVDKEGKYIKWL